MLDRYIIELRKESDKTNMPLLSWQVNCNELTIEEMQQLFFTNAFDSASRMMYAKRNGLEN